MRKLDRAVLDEIRIYLSAHLIAADEADVAARDMAVPAEPAPEQARPKFSIAGKRRMSRECESSGSAPVPFEAVEASREPTAAESSRDLSEILVTLDESFQEMLLRKIDEKGMKDSDCYKRAGVDRKLFSKIRSNPAYRPKKTTVVAFIMALELNLDEAREMLLKAGFALSHSSKFDVIVEYFIIHRRYSVMELNEALYEFDQPLI